jgi:aminopeptidase N
MRRFYLLFLLIFSVLWANAQSFCSHFKPDYTAFAKSTQIKDLRTDSFEVNHYHINLDITDFISREIKGYTDVKIQSKINGLQHIRLDLLKLKINKISIANTTLNYTYNDTNIIIDLGTARNVGDTFTIRVEYEGVPQKDAQWGGFYFSGVYAWNMGVGFAAEPHNFGRVWFPCVDDFKSRSLYDFTITAKDNNQVLCNGLLQSEADNNNGTKTWHWKLSNTIPTYLASIVVAPIFITNDTYNSTLSGNTPITLSAGDTTKMKASFANLKGAFAGFEKWYGKHRFERVGFHAVPFNAGAMEHATNIAYPIYASDGTLNNETLMAHEFAHHWWGNNITCRTAEDMWLNEGWASYSESIFLEHVYGKQRYKESVMANHIDVLRWAHLRDGKPRAISGVPHAYTYGQHVYNKGADVAHTLRGYMGDADFEKGIKDFQEKYKYSDVSSEDFKNTLQTHTSANLTSFFDNWVYEAGFPAFSAYIEGVTPTQGNYNCTVKVHQQLRFTNKTYTHVPLTLSFVNQSGAEVTENITVNKRDTTFIFSLPIEPILVIADRDEKLSDAVSENEQIIQFAGIYNYSNAFITLNAANNISGGELVRVEHHWTAPVPSKVPYPNLYASESRYWRVIGTWKDSLLPVTATIVYDGSTPGGFGSGWLDNDLIKTTEDSLVLLHRTNASEQWTIYPHYTKTTGNKNDRRGNIALNGLKKGEYVLAMYDRTLGVTKPTDNKQGKLKIYPNPTSGFVRIEFDDVYRSTKLHVIDNKGASIKTIPIYTGQNFIKIDTTGWRSGIYYLGIGNIKHLEKLVIE